MTKPLHIENRLVSGLKPYEKNSKIHDKKQVKQIAASIKEFGFNVPILIDGDNNIIAGHGRVLACKELGIEEVSAICVEHLTDAQKRAFVIADNKLAENAEWDTEMLALELKELGSLDLSFDLDITGFSTSDIDLIISDDISTDEEDGTSDEELPDMADVPMVAAFGDIWQLGRHKLICGDSRDAKTYERLLGERKADMALADPPYNVPIGGYVLKDRKPRHTEFAMASGEMSNEEFTEFLSAIFGNLAAFSKNGSIHYIFMNWRHMYELLTAGQKHYKELKNLCVWNKTNAGLGAFYRNKHELIFVFKNGSKPHINNFEMGDHGRFRTNIWDYPSSSSFYKDAVTGETRDQLIKLHPTLCPVQMLVDMMMDCSKRNQLILDPFCGSGPSLIAAEKTGRCCHAIEYEPKFVDAAIYRWEKFPGEKAIKALS